MNHKDSYFWYGLNTAVHEAKMNQDYERQTCEKSELTNSVSSGGLVVCDTV